MDTDTGSTLPQIPGGRYHTIERLSAGAIGAVYKALDTILDRPVAVKCIHLDTPFAEQSPEELRERFVREARIAARLQHPNIVTIHDIVATGDRGFMIMEFIEGMSLEALLAQTKRLSMPEAIRVASQLASALDYAHSRNVIHRDVKPVNILVSPSLWVWVADFGIAKSELSTNLTMAGGVLGTPDYMSPEQAKGEDVDARSDLFSLGCILFECVTGEKPFRSPSLTGVLLSIINDDPVFPLNWRSLGLPNGLKPVLHHALEKEREKRYASGAELVKALEALQAPVKTAPAVAVLTPPAEAKVAEPPLEATSKVKIPTLAEEQISTTTPAPLEASAPSDASLPSEEAPAQEAPAPAPREASAPAPAETLAPTEPESHLEPEVAAAREVEAVLSAEAEPTAPFEPEVAAARDILAALSAEAEPTAPSESPERDAQALSEEPEEVEEPSPKRKTFTVDETIMPPPSPLVNVTRIKELKEESRPLRLSPNLSGELQGAAISPEEGFLLSRIDGHSRADEILAMSPMSEVETAVALLNLLDKALIQFGGRAPVSEPVKGAEPSAPKVGPDEATLKELDHLLSFAKSQAYADLLGVAEDASAGARKSAYLKIIGRFHPDKFPRAAEEVREKLSRLCAEAAEALERMENPKPGAPAANGPSNGGANIPLIKALRGPHFNRSRYARELYDRALRAFDMMDYWESIQLVRQALETDDTRAEYFHLLGRALMQNKKWRKEAADNFRKASELEPGNLAYLGMLGAIYKAEGLQARANAILKKAQSLDPTFTLPEIDGEVEVEAS